jgi:hypothetical protein
MHDGKLGSAYSCQAFIILLQGKEIIEMSIMSQRGKTRRNRIVVTVIIGIILISFLASILATTVL